MIVIPQVVSEAQYRQLILLRPRVKVAHPIHVRLQARPKSRGDIPIINPEGECVESVYAKSPKINAQCRTQLRVPVPSRRFPAPPPENEAQWP